MKKSILTASLAASALVLAPAGASAATDCTEYSGDKPTGRQLASPANEWIRYTRTPDAWNAKPGEPGLQGQTATVTVTGKTTAKISLALLSYETTPPIVLFGQNQLPIGPQQNHAIDRVVLDGCETKTLTVTVPACHYQVDFIEAENLTDEQIRLAQFEGGLALTALIEAGVGGNVNCGYVEPPPPTTTETTPPPPPPTSTTTTQTNPVLSPVPTTPGSGGQGGSVGAGVPGSTKRACTAVTARSYRVRAKQRNTITVRVKTTSKTKPRVTLSGAGVKASKKVGSNNTAVFRVRPTRSGSIRVTATGCVKVANVRVSGAKTSQRSGSAPTFTG